MASQESLLVKFGGHEQAGGLTLAAESLPAFREGVNRHAAEHMPDDALEPVLNIHCVMEPSDITLENAKLLNMLEPFGQGNPAPILLVKGAMVKDVRRVGDGKHLRLRFANGSKGVDSVFFGQGELERHIRIGDRLDIVYSMSVQIWQGIGIRGSVYWICAWMRRPYQEPVPHGAPGVSNYLIVIMIGFIMGLIIVW